jgi:hypothetical protein
MNVPDLDPLLRQLRESRPAPSPDMTNAILARLGESSQQIRLVFLAGALSCVTAVALAVYIGTSVPQQAVRPAPPELTLLGGATNPLLSL